MFKGVKEVYRILDTGGTLHIVEPYKRWNDKRGFAFKLQPHFAYAAGGVALLSIGTGFGAILTESKFWNPQTSQQDLDSLRTKTNVLSGMTIGFGMVSMGLLTTSIITGEW